jgi:hypothetical protein
MRNEYLVLYAIADLFIYHLINSEVAKVIEGEIIVQVPEYKLSKADRAIMKDMFAILQFLNKEFTEVSFKAIKAKYENILKGFENNRFVKQGWAALPAALSIYSEYVKNNDRKFKVHKNRVAKLTELVAKEAQVEGEGEYRHLSPLILNSYQFGEMIYRQITGENDVRKSA